MASEGESMSYLVAVAVVVVELEQGSLVVGRTG